MASSYVKSCCLLRIPSSQPCLGLSADKVARYFRIGSAFRSFWHTMTSYDRRQYTFPPPPLCMLTDNQIQIMIPLTERVDTFLLTEIP